MAMYDQSLGLIAADRRAQEARDRAAFWKSVAQRWLAGFDYLASCLDPDDPETAEVIAEAERIRQSIPLDFGDRAGGER